MKHNAIKIQGLGKKYMLGQRGASYVTLRDSLVGLFKKAERTKKEDKELWALKDINIEIKRGEVVGIIGRNGAGKSTLLKVLSRITEPSEGRVELHGRVGSLLEVGTGFHPELTGRENIYLNGSIIGMRRREIEAKFDEIVAFAEIEKFLDTPVKFYSSGMYVRLAFAVAAHLEPEILLVDEVLAVGDILFQKKCLGKMQDVANEGRTVLFVSHNMELLNRLCSKGVFLEDGKFVDYGDITNAVNRYVSQSLFKECIHSASYENDTKKKICFKHLSIEKDASQIKVGIEYAVNDLVDGVIAVKVEDVTGFVVTVVTDCDLAPNNFHKEKGMFYAEVVLNTEKWKPNRYMLTFSAADMKTIRFDYSEKALVFDVFMQKEIKYVVSNREGFLFCPTQWGYSKKINQESVMQDSSIKCVVCESNLFKVIFEAKIDGDADLIRCNECGLVFVNPLPTEDSVNIFYNGLYKDIANEVDPFKVEYTQRTVNSYLKQIKKECSLTKKTVLDVGGGLGYYSKAFQDIGYDVTLLELDDVSCRFASERLGIKNIAKTSVYSLDTLENQSYDIVLFRHVIEHLYAPNTIIENLYRILDSSGVLILETDNNSSIELLLRSDSRKYYIELYKSLYKKANLLSLIRKKPFAADRLRHLYAYNLANLKILLKKHGFSIVDAKCYRLGHPVYWPNLCLPSLKQMFKDILRLRLKKFLMTLLDYILFPLRLVLERLDMSAGILIIAKKKVL